VVAEGALEPVLVHMVQQRTHMGVGISGLELALIDGFSVILEALKQGHFRT
jgi:hypothetical protein